MACNTSGEPAGRWGSGWSRKSHFFAPALAGTVQSRNCGALLLYPNEQRSMYPRYRPRGDPSGLLYPEIISPAHPAGVNGQP